MPSTATDRLNGTTTSVALKAPVKAVTSANITLSGLQTVGGVALAEDDRVLVKDQTDSTENGIYLASTSDWTRAKDFDGNRDAVKGTLVVTDGVSTALLFYRLTTADPVIIGTSAITFVQASEVQDPYPRTAAEIAAGVTPIDYAKEPCVADRYGANEDGIIAAIKVAITGGTRLVRLAPGNTYTIDAPVVFLAGSLDNFRLTGEGASGETGTGGAVITGTHSGDLIQSVGGSTVEIDHITFKGSACTAIAVDVMVKYHIHHCRFDAELTECIDGKLLLSTIEDNTFGYFGTPGVSHRHIRSIGSIANPTNHNVIRNNRFSQAVGNYSCELAEGTLALFDGNDWEENDCPTIACRGIEYVFISRCWFEANAVTAGTPYEIFIDASVDGTLPRIIKIENSQFGVHSDVDYILSITSTGSVTGLVFRENNGFGMSGRNITNYNSVLDDGIVEWQNNRLAGYSRINHDVTKATLDSFIVHRSSTVANVTGDGTAYTILFATELQDSLSTYDGSTGKHTAACTGLYHYDASVHLSGIASGHVDGEIDLVIEGTSARTYKKFFHPFNCANSGGNLSIGISADVPMTVGDTAKVVVSIGGSTKVVGVSYGSGIESWFDGKHVIYV